MTSETTDNPNITTTDYSSPPDSSMRDGGVASAVVVVLLALFCLALYFYFSRRSKIMAIASRRGEYSDLENLREVQTIQPRPDIPAIHVSHYAGPPSPSIFNRMEGCSVDVHSSQAEPILRKKSDSLLALHSLDMNTSNESNGFEEDVRYIKSLVDGLLDHIIDEVLRNSTESSDALEDAKEQFTLKRNYVESLDQSHCPEDSNEIQFDTTPSSPNQTPERKSEGPIAVPKLCTSIDDPKKSPGSLKTNVISPCSTSPSLSRSTRLHLTRYLSSVMAAPSLSRRLTPSPSYSLPDDLSSTAGIEDFPSELDDGDEKKPISKCLDEEYDLDVQDVESSEKECVLTPTLGTSSLDLERSLLVSSLSPHSSLEGRPEGPPNLSLSTVESSTVEACSIKSPSPMTELSTVCSSLTTPSPAVSLPPPDYTPPPLPSHIPVSPSPSLSLVVSPSNSMPDSDYSPRVDLQFPSEVLGQSLKKPLL